MDGRQPDRGLQARAADTLRANYGPAVAVVLVQSAFETLPLVTGTGTSVATLVVLASSATQMVLSYLLLYTLMTGESAIAHPFPWPGFWGFCWRLVVLGLPPAVVLLFLLSAGEASLFPVLFTALASLAITGLFGTVLPDVLAGGAGRFGDAFARGSRHFGSFVAWTIGGPFLAMIVLGLALGLVAAVLVGAAGPEAEPRPWAVGLLTLLAALGGAWVTALMASVLARLWAAGGGIVTPRR